ncbi:unnamed protein product [Heligmosomoides polygyrus]|uniref:G_PROTEIN_RECEP_F1_2 domain-containing protein n=1 Tax=Heligmosomoides polygyrus TaxID=6339 RepID=A0A3P7Y4B9_HELPZ|nr:unnamed protein product [Heligmosomoides polygyrus]
MELGTTKPGRRKVDKQTWLWTDDVKAKVREKKSLYHVFLGDRTADNRQKYQKAKKAAKKAVTVAKATHYGDVYRILESRDAHCFISGFLFFLAPIINPILYNVVSARFRKASKDVVMSVFCPAKLPRESIIIHKVC